MIAEVGWRLKVSGINSATPVMGPIPGRTPMSVPRKTPPKQSIRLNGVPATPNPRVTLLQKWLKKSMFDLLSQKPNNFNGPAGSCTRRKVVKM